MSKPNFRDQILTAGLKALHSRGFNATSVQDITEAAGVPKGSFYNHFASKEDLGAAVVEQYTLRTAKRRAILADVRLAPMARIRSYFEAMVALPKYPGAPGCLLGNFGAELSNQSPAIRERVSVTACNHPRTGSQSSAGLAHASCNWRNGSGSRSLQLGSFSIATGSQT